MRLWLLAAALSGAALIGLGAYDAHGLTAADGAASLFDTAWRYHALHTLALLAVAMLGLGAAGRRRTVLHLAALLFALGTLLFSGSLYLLALPEAPALPFTAPAGGIVLILAWLALAAAALL